MTVRLIEGFDLGTSVSWNNLQFSGNVCYFIETKCSSNEFVFLKGDRPPSSPEFTGGVFGHYRFALGIGGLQGQLAASANYQSYIAHEDRGADYNAPTRVGFQGDNLLFMRASVGVKAISWTADFFVDNLNNERGGILGNVLNDPGLYTRFRPRTYGVQFQYHFH